MYISITERWVSEMLSIRDPKEYDRFMGRKESTLYVLHKACEFVEGLPMSDLPLYLGHPSATINDIVKKRLMGRKDFFYKEYYK